MSSLGSHSAVPRVVPPPAALPRVPIGQIGTPCPCGAGPVDDASNPHTASTFSTGPPTALCDGLWDMRVEMTVNAWDTGKTGTITLALREVHPANTSFYALEIAISAPTVSSWTIKRYVASTPTTIAGPTASVNFTAGDVIEFKAIGTALTAKKNGVTIVSATDSTIVGTATHENGIFAGYGMNPAGAGCSTSFVYEDYCTNRIAP